MPYQEWVLYDREDRAYYVGDGEWLAPKDKAKRYGTFLSAHKAIEDLGHEWVDRVIAVSVQ